MPNIDTAAAVLAKASLFDPSFSNPDLGIAVAWAEALGGVNQGDALAAVTDHYQQQTRRIMPADVLAGVRAIRKERLRDQPLEPDYDGEDVRGALRQIKAHRRAVGDGLGLTPVAEELTRDVTGLIQGVIDVMPTIPTEPDYTHNDIRRPSPSSVASGGVA